MGWAKPPGADPCFGSEQQIEEVQRLRKRALIRAFLDGEVDGDLRAAVLEACTVELEANGLWPVVA